MGFQKKHLQKSSGFTIIELLVVIVVIAILAAIAIVFYNGIQQRAAGVVLQSDLRNAATQLEIERQENDGQYPASDAGLKRSEGTEFEYESDGFSYCLSATSNRAGVPGYHVSSDNLTVSEGVCDGHAEPGGGSATGWSSVAAGLNHTCGVYNGAAYCWGQNDYGQLGNGTTSGSNPTPTAVTTGSFAGAEIEAIGAGRAHSCLLAGGSVYCWGRNNYGQIGDGTTNDRYQPTAVNPAGAWSPGSVTELTVGTDVTCVIANNNSYCWGLGQAVGAASSPATQYPTPTAVNMSGLPSGVRIVYISGSTQHTCGVGSNGWVYCWGYATTGGSPLGNNSTNPSYIPVALYQTPALAGQTFSTVSAGQQFSCGVSSARAYCWGTNSLRQLGNGTTTASNVATPVSSTGAIGTKSVTDIAAGAIHTCAIAEGDVYCWGYNHVGQLGVGDTATYNDTVAVNGSGTIADKQLSSLTTMNAHTCIIADGDLYCWGLNNFGQIGVGTTDNALVPILVPQP